MRNLVQSKLIVKDQVGWSRFSMWFRIPLQQPCRWENSCLPTKATKSSSQFRVSAPLYRRPCLAFLLSFLHHSLSQTKEWDSHLDHWWMKVRSQHQSNDSSWRAKWVLEYNSPLVWCSWTNPSKQGRWWSLSGQLQDVSLHEKTIVSIKCAFLRAKGFWSPPIWIWLPLTGATLIHWCHEDRTHRSSCTQGLPSSMWKDEASWMGLPICAMQLATLTKCW